VTKLTAKQEKFAQKVVLNGGDKVKARAGAGYSMRMSKPSQSVDADNLYNNPKVSLRIAELQKEADKIAKKAFTISVEQRLTWLKDITEAGLGTYRDQGMNERRENLSASTGAIKIMNEMLGDSNDEEKALPLEIKFEVAPAISDIKITNAKT